MSSDKLLGTCSWQQKNVPAGATENHGVAWTRFAGCNPLTYRTRARELEQGQPLL